MSIEKFKFWCHKVLPLVYDDSLSYYELLCKVVKKINEVIDSENEVTELVGSYETRVSALETEVTTLSGDVANIKPRLDEVEDDLESLYARVGVIEGDIVDIRTDVRNLETIAVTALTRANNAQTAVDAVEDRMDTAESDIDSLETRMGTAEGDIDSLETRMGDVEDSVEELDNTTVKNDELDDLVVGNAKQLVATVGINDNAPYLFRTSGGTVDIGDRETDEIVGGTVAWNQFVKNGNFEDASYWTTTVGAELTVSNNVATVHRDSGTEIQAQIAVSSPKKSVTGHKYLFAATVQTTNGLLIFMPTGTGSEGTSGAYTSYPTKTRVSFIWSAGVSADILAVIRGYTGSGVTSAIDFTVENYIYSDLTLAFGSAIADNVYTLETATAGAGIAWLRKYGFFNKPYYPYNDGQLISVKTSAHKMVGFNAWDEQWELGGIRYSDGTLLVLNDRIRSKNFCHCIPNTVYYVKIINGSPTAIFWYDADENYISYNNVTNTTLAAPSNAHYFKIVATNITTYSSGICINLSWDGERDGEYEPYVEYNYPLDSDLELRGIAKLDANNNLYYDGDAYESDGKVARRYKIVDMGTVEWIKGSTGGNTTFHARFSDMLSRGSIGYETNIICGRYAKAKNASEFIDKSISGVHVYATNNIVIKDNSYETVADFKAAMSGVMLVYELATPTTESAEPYTNPQIVDDFGTEEYIDEREVPIPVGHNTIYSANLRAKLEMAPDSPDGDGDFIVRQTNGTNEYVPLPNIKCYQHNIVASFDSNEVSKLYITKVNNSATPITLITSLDSFVPNIMYAATGYNSSYKQIVGIVFDTMVRDATIYYIDGTNATVTLYSLTDNIG